MKKFTDRNWRIVDALNAVARETGKPSAQVALNWVATQPGITSTILGATKIAQLEDNLASLSFEIPTELRLRLDAASAIDVIHPYLFYGPALQAMITGGSEVRAWMPARV